MDDVVKTTIFYDDVEDFSRLNEVYARYMPDPPPARSAPATCGSPRSARLDRSDRRAAGHLAVVAEALAIPRAVRRPRVYTINVPIDLLLRQMTVAAGTTVGLDPGPVDTRTEVPATPAESRSRHFVTGWHGSWRGDGAQLDPREQT